MLTPSPSFRRGPIRLQPPPENALVRAAAQPSVEDAHNQSRFQLSLAGGRRLSLSRQRPVVMGVVNITPDSFSDGGNWLAPEQALAHAERLLHNGADLLDLGAESSRPGGGIYGDGAAEISSDEELRRLLPVLKKLRVLTEKPISVDTRKAAVAHQALDNGADLINDIGGLNDSEMIDLVAQRGCPVVIMHSRGTLGTMQQGISFDHVVSEVRDELKAVARRAERAGVSQIILDPGIGFGKSSVHNLQLTNGLDQLAALGYPILFGSSRKRYLGEISGRNPQHRVAASLASVARVLGCASMVRVHDVAETVNFLRVWYAHQQPEQLLSPSPLIDRQPADEAFPQQDFPEPGSS